MRDPTRTPSSLLVLFGSPVECPDLRAHLVFDSLGHIRLDCYSAASLPATLLKHLSDYSLLLRVQVPGIVKHDRLTSKHLEHHLQVNKERRSDEC